MNPDDYPIERKTSNGTGRPIVLYRCTRCTDDPEVAGDPCLVLDPGEHELKAHADG